MALCLRARTHATHKTPHVANGVVLALAMIAAVVFAFAFPPAEKAPPSYMVEFLYLAGIGGITISDLCLCLCAALVWFRKSWAVVFSLQASAGAVVAILGAGAASMVRSCPTPIR